MSRLLKWVVCGIAAGVLMPAAPAADRAKLPNKEGKSSIILKIVQNQLVSEVDT